MEKNLEDIYEEIVQLLEGGCWKSYAGFCRMFSVDKAEMDDFIMSVTGFRGHDVVRAYRRHRLLNALAI